MKKMFSIACAIFLFFVFGSLNAFAVPTVINPSFEVDVFGSYSLNLGGAGCTNPLTGWTTNCNGTYPWGLTNGINPWGAGPTPYGSQWVVVGYFGQGGTYIEQSVSGFTVGETYTLGFALASEWPSSQGALVEVSFPFGSSTAAQTFEAPLADENNDWDTWDTFSMDFVADNTDVTIRFLGLAGAGYDAGIDNVSITGGDGHVPEPATLLLLGSGLIGVGFARKRFKK